MERGSLQRTAVAVAVAFVLVELLSIPFADVPVGIGVFFGALWAVTAWLLTREGWVGIAFLGALSLIEAAFVPFLPGADVGAWVLQMVELALGLAGLVLTFMLVQARRTSHSS